MTSNAARVRYGTEAFESVVFVFCSGGRSAPIARTILTSREQSTHPSMASQRMVKPTNNIYRT